MAESDLARRVNAIQNTAEVIAHSLKEMIYQAALKPGQPLIQERIAEMFQVSRVPVRDALQMLIGMGIVVNVPRRGVIVRPLSRKLLDDLFEMRTILEGAAIRMVVRNATPELLRRLDEVVRRQADCLKRGDVKQYGVLDEEFHQVAYAGAGNLRLVELVRANWEMIKHARSASIVMPEHGKEWMASSLRRHRRVLAALGKRDEHLSHTIVLENIQSSKREIVACLKGLGWLEPVPGPERLPRNIQAGASAKPSRGRARNRSAVA